MRTCIYSRKSTHKLGQKETIENQIKICKRYAQDNGLDVIEIKTDTGTGTDDLNRPEVKKLINDAVEGKYECVIMKGISRLYRDTEKGLGLIKLLDRNKIRVITVEEHFDSFDSNNRTGTGKLDLSRITMYLMFSEMESKKLADRIKYTQIEKAKNGEWNHANNTPFGYKFNSETKKLDIEHSTSFVVKLIFDLYEQGMGMRTIQHYLNGDNPEGKIYPSPKSNKWSQYTIGFILQNQAYVGSVVYNKRSKKERTYKQPELYGKDKGDIWVGNDWNDPEDWIITENAHEPIITVEQFEKVQEMMNIKAKRKGIRSNVGLLAGIAKCGKCGGGLTFKRGNKDSKGRVKTKDNYYCMQYIKYGKKFCSSHHFGAKDLEDTIVNHLVGMQSNKDLLDNIFKKAHSQVPQKTNNLAKEKERLENEMQKVMTKMDKLLEKNLNEEITDLQFKNMNEKYSKELEIYSEQLEQIMLKMDVQDELDDQEKYFKNKLQAFAKAKELNKEQIRHLLLDLVHQIIVDEDLNVKVVYKFNEIALLQ